MKAKRKRKNNAKDKKDLRIEHHFYNRTFLGKVWTIITGATWIILIVAVLYESLENYKSNFLGLSISAIGLTLLFISKVSVFKKNHNLSLGIKNMTQKMIYSYILGYIFLILGVFFIFF